jgi:hypothetical protein
MARLKSDYSLKELEGHLASVLSSNRFLKREGLNNEVPFFILPYQPSQSADIDRMRARVLEGLHVKGVSVLAVDLFDLALEILTERDLLGKLLANEAAESKSEIKDLLLSVLDPEHHLVPAIAKMLGEKQYDLFVMSGIGEVFPYIRSHNVLNNLQSTAKEQPTLMFFPGEYTQGLETGASLDLFGRLHDDKYYRAFDITKYEV